MRRFRQFSAHRTKCHDCHGICTLSPLDAALPMRFAKNTQHDTSKVLRLPRKSRWTRPKCCACHENCNTSSENVTKVLRLPRKKRLSTRYKTHLNVTKCHACHAKRSNQTSETSKKDPSCRTSIGTAIRSSHERLRTVADGCDHKRNVERTHPQPPDPQSETGTLATHSGKILFNILDRRGGGLIPNKNNSKLGSYSMHWLLGCPDDTRRIEKRAFTAQWLEADMVWKALGVAPGVLRMIYKQFRYQGSDKGGKLCRGF